MRLNYLAKAIGLTMIYIGLVTLTPIITALYYHDFNSILPFVTAGAISSFFGWLFMKLVPNTGELENLNDIKKAEALFIVALSWVIFGIVAGIPYLFYGISPLDAMFESVSGITTTGATILTNFDYPKTFFFWRSLTQWLGGLGIIVLFVAILPQFAVAGRQMFFAEAPGPTEDKFTPRIRNTASALWKVYAGLTILNIIFLVIAGMPKFDAVCNSFSTLSAAGFSPNAQSIMGYHSNWINWITIIFMFLAGASFNIQYKAIVQKNPFILFKNEEFKLYFFLVMLMAVLITISLVINTHYGVFQGFTDALYQVVSITTSTGSANVDFVQWDYVSKVLLFIVMFMGSCSGSAGGGIKMTTFVVLMASVWNMLLGKRDVVMFGRRIEEKTVDKSFVITVLCLLWVVFAVMVLVVLSNGEHSFIQILFEVMSGFGTVGLGIGITPGWEPLGKWILILTMYIGRIGILTFALSFLQSGTDKIRFPSEHVSIG